MDKTNKITNLPYDSTDVIVNLIGGQSHQLDNGRDMPPFRLRAIMALPVGLSIPILVTPTMQRGA